MIFRFEIRDNSMFIHTYKLYLNLNINQYGKPLVCFQLQVGRLVDTFVYQRSSDTCVFDMFYLCSFRSLFTYSPDSSLTSLLLGNYVEIINLLDLSKHGHYFKRQYHIISRISILYSSI